MLRATAIYPPGNFPSIKRLQGALRELDVKLTLRSPRSSAPLNCSPSSPPLLNWGCSMRFSRQRHTEPAWSRFLDGSISCPMKLINHPRSVTIAQSKIKTWQALSTDPTIHIPEYRTNQLRLNVITRSSNIVLLRTDGGSGGEDIRVVRANPDDSQEAQRYIDLHLARSNSNFAVAYIKKRKEWRVHATPTSIISVSEKRRESGVVQTQDEALIRNRANGWVFCRSGVELPEAAAEMAKKTIASLDLDFGAVDLIEGHDGKIYILEVNTAPGLEGQTLLDYATYIKSTLESLS